MIKSEQVWFKEREKKKRDLEQFDINYITYIMYRYKLSSFFILFYLQLSGIFLFFFYF